MGNNENNGGIVTENDTSRVGVSRTFDGRGGFYRHIAALMKSMMGVSRRSQHVGMGCFNRHLSKAQVSIEKFFCIDWEGMEAMPVSQTCCRISIARAIQISQVTLDIALLRSADAGRNRVLLT